MNAPDLHSALVTPAWRNAAFLQRLGPAFGADLPPQPVPAPHWVAQSRNLARALGLADWLGSSASLAMLSGAQVAIGTLPHASVYAGHQFGVWAGQLGDGRALMLGEIDTAAGPMEIQLKGSGLTPYSRMGDGRAVLRSSIREFLGSEAMHALGIPTTRALAVIGSPLPVRRETMETAAVVTRVAPSFLRFGHFEHFAHVANDTVALRRLLEATIARYFPDLQGHAQPAAALLQEVSLRTARLIAQWQAVGFCHGVMNTDNMSIARPDHRLRSVRFSGRVRSRPRLQPQRQPGPLCLCAPTGRRVLEPACPGTGAAAGGRRPARGSRRASAGRARAVQGRIRSGHAGGVSGQARSGQHR